MKSIRFAKPKRWRALLISATALIPLLGVGAATASILPNDMGQQWQQWVLEQYSNPLDYLLGQLGKVDPIFETIMDVALGDDWGGIQSEQGELPEPYELRTTKPSKGPGILSTSPIVQQRDWANLYVPFFMTPNHRVDVIKAYTIYFFKYFIWLKRI